MQTPLAQKLESTLKRKMIDISWSPTWEEYQAAKAESDAALGEHRSLLGLQSRFYHYRQRLDAGDLTVEELLVMDAVLQNAIDKPVKH
jgi:hypothetical protein